MAARGAATRQRQRSPSRRPGGTLGFVIAAVSPAVVVPGMLDLQARGFGTAKGIPTMVVAAASFDDVLAIAGES